MADRRIAVVVGQILSSLLQIGLAIAIIAIVRNDLYYGVWVSNGFTTTTITTCLLSTDANNRICNYAYSIGSVNLIFSLALIVVAFIPDGRLAGVACLNVFLSIWMLVGAIVITVYAHDANAVGYPQESYRNSIIGMCWASFGLTVLVLGGAALVLARRSKRGADDAMDGMTKPAGRYDAEQPAYTQPMPTPEAATVTATAASP